MTFSVTDAGNFIKKKLRYYYILVCWVLTYGTQTQNGLRLEQTLQKKKMLQILKNTETDAARQAANTSDALPSSNFADSK